MAWLSERSRHNFIGWATAWEVGWGMQPRCLWERALHIADCHCLARGDRQPALALRNAYPLRPLLKALRFVPAALAGQAGKLAPSIGAFAMNFLLANGKLIEPQYLKRLAPLALSPVSTKLIDQIAGWFDHNRNHPLELGWQWDQLSNVTTPVLALAGSVDQLAPEHNVRELLGRVSSTDKNLLVCGKHTGFSADFGHIDIMLSTPARLEIYPRIAQWLKAIEPPMIRCNAGSRRLSSCTRPTDAPTPVL